MITEQISFTLHEHDYELFYHDNHHVYIHRHIKDTDLLALKLHFSPSLDNTFYNLIVTKGAIKTHAGSFIQLPNDKWFRCQFENGMKDYITQADIPECFIEVFRFMLTYKMII